MSERRRAVVEGLLAERGEVAIAELAERFRVSEMTIRRDLEALEAAGAAKRVRGGAIATVSRGYEPPYAARTTTEINAKRAIARAAAERIEDGETVILDVGSTT